MYRCKRKNCRKSMSIFKNTFFNRSRLTPSKILHLWLTKSSTETIRIQTELISIPTLPPSYNYNSANRNSNIEHRNAQFVSNKSKKLPNNTNTNNTTSTSNYILHIFDDPNLMKIPVDDILLNEMRLDGQQEYGKLPF